MIYGEHEPRVEGESTPCMIKCVTVDQTFVYASTDGMPMDRSRDVEWYKKGERQADSGIT